MKSDTLESAKPKLTRESYDENWNMTTDTPRNGSCPHCGAEEISAGEFECGSLDGEYRSERCRWREYMNKLGAEVERQMQLEIDKADAEVARLTRALASCWHAANTYEANYTRACDNVMKISSEALSPNK